MTFSDTEAADQSKTTTDTILDDDTVYHHIVVYSFSVQELPVIIDNPIDTDTDVTMHFLNLFGKSRPFFLRITGARNLQALALW